MPKTMRYINEPTLTILREGSVATDVSYEYPHVNSCLPPDDIELPADEAEHLRQLRNQEVIRARIRLQQAGQNGEWSKLQKLRGELRAAMSYRDEDNLERYIDENHVYGTYSKYCYKLGFEVKQAINSYTDNDMSSLSNLFISNSDTTTYFIAGRWVTISVQHRICLDYTVILRLQCDDIPQLVKPIRVVFSDDKTCRMYHKMRSLAKQHNF